MQGYVSDSLSDAALATPPTAPWASRLEADLNQLESRHTAGLGVYVRDLDTGESASHRADERWYLASTVKLPVAIAVLRGVDRGLYTLDTTLTLRAGDYVDGAGRTNSHPPGASLSLRYLLEQMMVHSDNTASDMLIGLVGVQEVNAVAAELAPGGIGRITTLADVRREVYAQVLPEARRLSGRDFLRLRAEPTDLARARLLGELLQPPGGLRRTPDLRPAYEAYYAGGLNSGRLDAYGEMLARLAEGRALGPKSTHYLLGVMARVQTGSQRIKAGLPAGAGFAHKTGTQRARVCDAGIVRIPRGGRDQRVVVVACAKGENVLARAELLLQQVGHAVCKSGLITAGVVDAPSCLPAARLVGPAPASWPEPPVGQGHRPEPGPGAGAGAGLHRR